MDVTLLGFSVLMLIAAAISIGVFGEMVSSTFLFPAGWALLGLICSFAYFDVAVSPSSTLALIIAIIVSIIGGVAGRTYARTSFRAHQPIRRLGLNIVVLRTAFWMVFAIVILVQYLIFLLVSDLPVVSTYENASAALYASTQSGFELPFAIRMAISCFYLLPALGGVICAHFSVRHSPQVLVASFVPSIFMMLIFTTKGSLVFSALCFASTYLATISCFGKVKLADINWAICVVGMLFFLALLFMASWLRYGYSSPSDLFLLFKKVRVDFFGSMFAFSTWFESREVGGEPGRWILFAGVMEVLGIQERVIGNFDVNVEFPGGGVTNVYTLFRGIFSDFGLTGGMLALFLLSFVYEYSLVSMKKNGGILKIVVVSTGMMVILWSPIVFPFAYNTLVVCFAALLIVLTVSRLLYRGGRPHEGGLQSRNME